MVMKIAVLPGDGIGPEIVNEAVKVLKVLDLPFQLDEAKVARRLRCARPPAAITDLPIETAETAKAHRG